jgi:hypothetical protein
MDYKQLLNPKGFANEKEREKRRDKVKIGTLLSSSFLLQQLSPGFCP